MKPAPGLATRLFAFSVQEAAPEGQVKKKEVLKSDYRKNIIEAS